MKRYKLIKVAYFLRMTIGSPALVGGALGFVAIIGLVAYTTSKSDPSVAMPMMTLAVSIAAPVLLLYVTLRVTLRFRRTSDHKYPPERYALIVDELRMRGVRDTSRFIEEHPEHYVCVPEVIQKVVSSVSLTEALELAALVYTEDDDPHRVKDAIVQIVNERCITSKNEVREILRDMRTIKPSIISGIL